jgi:two-component system cell cycle response regulator
MPGMDGYEVAQQVKLNINLIAVPLLAVTAYAMVGDREKVLEAGFDGYIPKPINPEIFLGQVEEFLPAEKRSADTRP